MYTKYVYTVPITAVDTDFPLTMKRNTQVLRGTMYRKCVYTVPITAVDTDFPLTLKEILKLQGERCIQNVYILFLLLQ